MSFGGTDEWQFDYETEKAVMLNLLQGIQGRGEGEEEDSPSQSSDVSPYLGCVLYLTSSPCCVGCVIGSVQ